MDTPTALVAVDICGFQPSMITLPQHLLLWILCLFYGGYASFLYMLLETCDRKTRSAPRESPFLVRTFFYFFSLIKILDGREPPFISKKIKNKNKLTKKKQQI